MANAPDAYIWNNMDLLGRFSARRNLQIYSNRVADEQLKAFGSGLVAQVTRFRRHQNPSALQACEGYQGVERRLPNFFVVWFSASAMK
jgi:hypothetical protein